jgi:Zn-dependent protease
MNSRSAMRGPGRSFRLAEYFGIEVRIHWSFAALVGGLGLWVLAETGSPQAVGRILIPIGMVFLCVVLHEYGHALTARHFGIRTRAITLLPIGGVAVLERNPSSPVQELWIAAAGPAVNFLLAGLIFALMLTTGGISSGLFSGSAEASTLSWLFRLNLLLGVFNLLPALPMDGGRILRASLALRMSNLEATRIASRAARGIAALMIFFGLTRGEWMLALIGGFVWSTAKAELFQAMAQQALQTRRKNHFGEAAQSPDLVMEKTSAGEWAPPHSYRHSQRSE